MEYKDKIISTIEKLRNRLIDIGMEKGFTAEETIECSQKLDSALYELKNSKFESSDIESPNINFNKVSSLVNNNASIFIIDVNKNILYISAKCCTSIGYQLKELIGHNSEILLPENQSIEFYQNTWKTIVSGRMWKGNLPLLRKDGSTIWVLTLIFPVPDENNRPYQFVLLNMDISDQKKREEMSIQKLKQLRSIVEMASEVMGCLDQNGTVIYVNPASILGYTVSESIGMNFFNYIDSQDMWKAKRTFEESKKNPDRVVSIELKLRSKSGSFIPCEVRLKNYLHDPLIKGIVFIYKDITEKKRLSTEMKQLAFFDLLTELPNRINFENELLIETNYAKTNNTSFAVLLLDIDNFKYINDTFEHNMGDLLLQDIANRIKATFDDDNIFIYRIGGDEFALILKEIVKIGQIHSIAKKLISSLNMMPFNLKNNEIFITASIGISVFPECGENNKEILKYAEMAMYRAKNNGKNQYLIFNKNMDVFSYKQFTLRNDMKRALLNDEFCICYQPRIHPVTNEILSAEALIRWKHPQWGIVAPVEFISIAEESGLIIPLGTWIIKNVCLQIKQWEEKKITYKKISINLSPLQLQQLNFVDIVSSILNETGVDSNRIEFEITETVMLDDDEQMLILINKLRNLGITFALDDYGTGYSTLNYLRRFPFDTVKLDKSLIQELHHDKNDYAIVQTVIELCHRLKKSVVAEGVELKEQLSLLQKLDCDEIQGYFYSKPIDVKEYTEFLKAGKWIPKNKEALLPQVNRRNYFRVNLEIPLVGDMTITKFDNKKVNIGSTEVLIKNIGPGGMCFHSSLKMPVKKDITLRFATEIFSNVLQLNGHIIWNEELNNDEYQYGIEFIIEETERENLVKILNHLQLSLKHKSILPNCRFLLK